MARIVVPPVKVQPGRMYFRLCFIVYVRCCSACVQAVSPIMTWGGVVPSDRDPLTVRETRYQRIAIRSTLFWCFLALCQQQYHYYVNANWNENCRPMKNVKFYLCLIEDDAMKAYCGMETLLHTFLQLTLRRVVSFVPGRLTVSDDRWSSLEWRGFGLSSGLHTSDNRKISYLAGKGITVPQSSSP